MTGGPKLLCLFLVTLDYVSVQSCGECLGLQTNTSCYCVVQNDSKDIDQDVCSKCTSHNLTYLAKINAFGSSYSTFYFLPGEHSLCGGVNVTHHALVNLTLIGLTSAGTRPRHLCSGGVSPIATIQCERGAGFHFANVTNLTIVGLKVHSCGVMVNISLYEYSAAIVLESVWNLTMCSVEILSTKGWGLLGQPVNGRSLISHTLINGSHSFGNFSGGNMLLAYGLCACKNTLLSIEHTNITNGRNNHTHFAYGSGLHVFLETVNNIDIQIDNVQFRGNVGGNGGNAAVIYKTSHGVWSSTITFVNCHFLSGSAILGGGIHITMSTDTVRSRKYSSLRSK